jgi:hypothetical protein
MSKFCGKESERAAEFRRVLADHGIILLPTVLDGTDSDYRTDGDMQWNPLVCYFIAEVKGEIGSTGAEPLLQAIWYYQESMKKPSIKHLPSPLPCLLIYLFGAFVKISLVMC